MNVTIYSTATCPYCKMLMSYLDEKGISYAKKMVDSDDAAREEMMKASGGFLGVPYTVIDNNGKVEKVVGFDKNQLNTILGLS